MGLAVHFACTGGVVIVGFPDVITLEWRDWNHDAYTPVLFPLSTIYGMDARHMTATAAPFHLLY